MDLSYLNMTQMKSNQFLGFGLCLTFLCFFFLFFVITFSLQKWNKINFNSIFYF